MNETLSALALLFGAAGFLTLAAVACTFWAECA